MDAQAQSRARRSPARPHPSARLPQAPHRREEFSASSRLAGAGAKIADQGHVRADVALRSPRRPPNHADSLAPRLPPQRRAPRSRVSPRGGGDASGTSTPSDATRAEQARLDASPRDHGEDFAESPRGEGAEVDGPRLATAVGDGHVDAMELARGGEALLRRLADLNNANADLRRQLELQVKEVSTLEQAGQSQQLLLREFERQAEHSKRAEAAAVEARVRAEVAEREAQLMTELEETKEQARKEREDFFARLREIDGQRCRVQGERDEARERVHELENKYDCSPQAAETQDTRTKALEMEINLLRSRFVREEEAKKAAEHASAESRAQQQELKVHLEREVAEVRRLQKKLAEQTELASFRQELCNDLNLKIQDQKSHAERKLRREKGKIEAVARMEGILPGHFVLKALA